MKPDQDIPDKNSAEEDEAPSSGQSPVESDADNADAGDDAEKFKKNHDRLGIDEEHMTSDMKKHHRGTFP